MFENVINNISTLLGISNTIIPDIITVIVVAIIFYLTLKGAVSWIALLVLLPLSMVVLALLLGTNSAFGIFSTLAVTYGH